MNDSMPPVTDNLDAAVHRWLAQRDGGTTLSRLELREVVSLARGLPAKDVAAQEGISHETIRAAQARLPEAAPRRAARLLRHAPALGGGEAGVAVTVKDALVAAQVEHDGEVARLQTEVKRLQTELRDQGRQFEDELRRVKSRAQWDMPVDYDARPDCNAPRFLHGYVTRVEINWPEKDPSCVSGKMTVLDGISGRSVDVPLRTPIDCARMMKDMESKRAVRVIL